MQYSIPIKWCETSKTLSGNVTVENLIASNPLPEGFFWMVVIRDGRAEFHWNRKVMIRDSGKGQVTLEGRSGFSCELVKAKISRGCKVQLLIAKGSRNMVTRKPPTPEKRTFILPFPIRKETLGQDLTHYREMRQGSRSTLDWVKALGWGETIGGAKLSGAFDAAVIVSRLARKGHIEDFNALERMGVVTDLPAFE